MKLDAREGGQIFRDLSKNNRQFEQLGQGIPDEITSKEFSSLLGEHFRLKQNLMLQTTAAGAVLGHRAEMGKIIFNGT
ncbi:hypothetical protein FEM54_24945 [Pseudomonas edaphica]|jgi:hypothetical protein|uniref:Uncharacterized protein n=1 Tax=Pseudomonas edaphica TaxID=2006980 RepID=A0A5R8QSP2_9PSED|nr:MULTISPECIES: hypothetical protein [Pseudomonas]MCF5139501.1 hypothetical protein [Pseudomonas sp. PA-6-3C]MCF5147112.1 hypothetical protein [Pseudomonas sp. PA-6-3F]MCF5159220.1 hypothetical protein [Pseudomonas sp. PA-6-2E]MCF5177439.1 hypothetical protein [Pseudomonas sp. PA-6-1D]MCF5191658.1 hypothetical protein [Pseudomonas sp. PA-6-1H]